MNLLHRKYTRNEFLDRKVENCVYPIGVNSKANLYLSRKKDKDITDYLVLNNIYYFSKEFKGVKGLQNIKRIVKLKKIEDYTLFSIGLDKSPVSKNDIISRIKRLQKKYKIHFIAKNGDHLRCCVTAHQPEYFI